MKLPRPLIALIGFLFISALIAATAHIRGEFRASSATANSSPAANSAPVAVDDGPIDVHGSVRLDQIMFANDTGDPPLRLDIIGQYPSHGALSFGDTQNIL